MSTRLPSRSWIPHRSRPTWTKPLRLDDPPRRRVPLGRVDQDPAQRQPALVDGGEGVPHGEPAGLGHHSLPAGLGMGPVADLRLAAGLQVEQGDRGEHLVGRRVGHRPADPGAGRRPLVPALEVVPRVGQRVRRGHRAEPPGRALVATGLDDPRGVLVAPGPEHHPLAGDPGHVQPLVPRGAVIVGVQHADPRVEELAALRQPPRQRAVAAEPQPPGRPARPPVAAVGPPDHRLETLVLEAPGQEQLQGPVHDPATPGPGVRAVGDLRPAVALVTELDRAAEAGVAVVVAGLHREHPDHLPPRLRAPAR